MPCEALAHAKVAASPPPVDIQLKQCQQFIDRTVKRMKDLDRSREVESVRLQEARKLQFQFHLLVFARSGASAEFLSQLQAQLAKSEGGVGDGDSAVGIKLAS